MPTFLNRSALIVRAGQPYADWADSFDDGGPKLDLAEHRGTPNAYLAHDRDESDDLDTLIRQSWKDIFEHELHAPMRDPMTWPPRRTPGLFRQGFEVELAPSVFDLSDGPLER